MKTEGLGLTDTGKGLDTTAHNEEGLAQEKDPPIPLVASLLRYFPLQVSRPG